MKKARLFSQAPLLSLASALVLSAAPALATDRYVSPAGSNVPPFECWEDAATTIQAAADACVDGDTVCVADGTYSITSQIAVTKGIVVSSVNGAQATIIDGGGASRGLWISHSNAVLDGFGVRNCVGTLDAGNNAGGILVVTNGLVRNCVIHNCSGKSGGGVALIRGGIVRNCLIYSNSTVAAEYGGGVWIQYSGVVENCTIVQNTSDVGAGICLNSGGRVTNSIVYGNTGSDNITVQIAGGTVSYSCMSPLIAGTGNTTNDPLFANVPGGDYRLSADSPCIDAGTNLPWMGGASDLEGNPRILGARADMGAYEGNAGDADEDGLPNWWELQWFGNVTNALPNVDPDGDGYSNLEEFHNRGNPTVFDVGSAYLWTAMEVGWKGVAGTNYRVQWKPGLSATNWNDLGSPVVGNGATNYVLDSTRTNSCKFYRVIVAP